MEQGQRHPDAGTTILEIASRALEHRDLAARAPKGYRRRTPGDGTADDRHVQHRHARTTVATLAPSAGARSAGRITVTQSATLRHWPPQDPMPQPVRRSGPLAVELELWPKRLSARKETSSAAAAWRYCPPGPEKTVIVRGVLAEDPG